MESLRMDWYSGTLEEYNRIVNKHNTEKLREKILLTPSHHRVREFGRETLVKLNINFTERRVYA